jgi:hypothetical protein
MQPKKRPVTRAGVVRPTTLDKGQGPRRPLGVQTMGPAEYEQLRRALHQLGGAASKR